jgi:DNA-binding FadR family transcriptional regulator
MPVTARDHAVMARAIAKGDEDGAARALDLLLDGIAAFTKATLTTDF